MSYRVPALPLAAARYTVEIRVEDAGKVASLVERAFEFSIVAQDHFGTAGMKVGRVFYCDQVWSAVPV